MKRALLTAIVGIAASVVNTYGQGHVLFSTYVGTVYQPVRIFGSNHDGIAGAGFQAELFYGLGAGVSFSAMTAIPSTITPINTTTAPGYITGGDAVIPNYVSGPITFAIVVFDGTQWDPTYTGRFGNTLETGPFEVRPWTETSINPTANPTDVFQQNVPPITITIPEPSMLVLVGFAGMGYLISRRRR